MIRIAENKLLSIVVWILFLMSGVYGIFIPAPVRNEYVAVLTGLLILNQVSSQPILSLENRTCRWLGSISYELYITHILVIMLLSMWYTKAGWQWPGIVIYLVCTMAAVLVSALAKCLSAHSKSQT